MTHVLNLHPRPFEEIRLGRKTIELRLWDEKRSRIRVGDTLVFAHSDDPTGDLLLRDVVADDAFIITRSTGDVIFDDCDAASLTVKTTTGSITGTLLTPKDFDAHTTTGDVSVPASGDGGKCELNATTGDIRITIQ